MATGMDRPEEKLTLAEFRELFESVSTSVEHSTT
jgi:hypothetical protein